MLNYYNYLDDEFIRKKNCEIKLETIKKILPRGSKILDIGTADGLFLKCLNENGYRVEGIDISKSMINLGEKKYSIKIHNVDFESEWPFEEKFDAITCYASLSNVINPSKLFKNVI